MSPNITLEIGELQDQTVSHLVQRYEPMGASDMSGRCCHNAQ